MCIIKGWRRFEKYTFFRPIFFTFVYIVTKRRCYVCKITTFWIPHTHTQSYSLSLSLFAESYSVHNFIPTKKSNLKWLGRIKAWTTFTYTICTLYNIYVVIKQIYIHWISHFIRHWPILDFQIGIVVAGDKIFFCSFQLVKLG